METPTEMNSPVSNSKNSWAVPVAIIVGFALIAGAIYFSGSKDTAVAPTPTPIPEEEDLSAINPVTADDHILGNPNAAITLVEYSDYDCPFCKNFHETMKQIMTEYGTEGKVAWVYRHFPLEQLHPNAASIAQASECVAELAGNEGFWKFTDLVFGERTTNEPTQMDRLAEFAVSAGADETAYNECVASGRYQAAVEEDYNNALQIGARGTPYTVVIVGDQQGVINGAQPYGSVKAVIDNLLGQIEGGN